MLCGSIDACTTGPITTLYEQCVNWASGTCINGTTEHKTISKIENANGEINPNNSVLLTLKINSGPYNMTFSVPSNTDYT